MDKDQLISELADFQQVTIDMATGSNEAYMGYEDARGQVLSIPELVRHLRSWVMENRFSSQMWSFMKRIATGDGSYEERRRWFYASFAESFASIERSASALPEAAAALVESCTSSAVQDTWEKVNARRIDDPEGCVTAARSMLESVCKYVLTEHGVQISNTDDLPALYKKTATVLDLSVQGEHEQELKQLLSGCFSVVSGLSGLRNRVSDSHGSAPGSVKPMQRHVDLMASVSGSIAAFLIATHEDMAG